MSEPAIGANPDLPADPVLTTNGAAVFDVPSDCGLTVGERWRDLKIEALMPDHIGGASYLADHVGFMRKVVVRPMRITEATEWRRRAKRGRS